MKALRTESKRLLKFRSGHVIKEPVTSFFTNSVKLEPMMKKCCRVNRRQCKTGDTVQSSVYKYRGWTASDKNKYNRDNGLDRLLAIKLERTDTTLDLSQKAKRAAEEIEGGGRDSIYTFVGCRVA